MKDRIQVKRFADGQSEVVIKVQRLFRVTGDSLWMTELGKKRDWVYVEEMTQWVGSDLDSGEVDDLCVWFTDWDCEELGLLYSDTGFEESVNRFLISLGFSDSKVIGSEQGMQGSDHVSFDAEEIGSYAISTDAYLVKSYT